jgi:quercetin dioxygenase-like cupin family protein
MPIINEAALEGPPEGRVLEGARCGATISLIFDRCTPGHRVALHRHPYDETWIVRAGRPTFMVGADRYEASAGDVVVVPRGVAHSLANHSDGPCDLLCIHSSPTLIHEWLE